MAIVGFLVCPSYCEHLRNWILIFFSFTLLPNNHSNIFLRFFSWIWGQSDSYVNDHYHLKWMSYANRRSPQGTSAHLWQYEGKNGWDNLYINTKVKTENCRVPNIAINFNHIGNIYLSPLSSMKTSFASDVQPWDLCSILTKIHVHFFWMGPHSLYVEVLRLGFGSELQLPAYTTVTATAMPDIAVCGNARSLTHWARPKIQPTSSWILVRFLTHWATTGTPYQVL